MSNTSTRLRTSSVWQISSTLYLNRLYTWITRRPHKTPEVPKPLGLARLNEGSARAHLFTWKLILPISDSRMLLLGRFRLKYGLCLDADDSPIGQTERTEQENFPDSLPNVLRGRDSRASLLNSCLIINRGNVITSSQRSFWVVTEGQLRGSLCGEREEYKVLGTGV